MITVVWLRVCIRESVIYEVNPEVVSVVRYTASSFSDTLSVYLNFSLNMIVIWDVLSIPTYLFWSKV